jgi:hypothetical protein
MRSGGEMMNEGLGRGGRERSGGGVGAKKEGWKYTREDGGTASTMMTDGITELLNSK